MVKGKEKGHGQGEGEGIMARGGASTLPVQPLPFSPPKHPIKKRKKKGITEAGEVAGERSKGGGRGRMLAGAGKRGRGAGAAGGPGSEFPPQMLVERSSAREVPPQVLQPPPSSIFFHLFLFLLIYFSMSAPNHFLGFFFHLLLH